MYTLSFMAIYMIIGVLGTAMIYIWGLYDSEVWEYSKNFTNTQIYFESVFTTPLLVMYPIAVSVHRKLDELV